VIDAGDFFGPRAPEREREKSRLVSDIMGVAKYDVVGIGEAELRYGLGFLRSRIETAGLPVVSANLVYRDSGGPIFDPYLILQRAGLRVGVTAISGQLEDFRGREDVTAWHEQNVTMADPKPALEGVVAEMKKKKVDVVIVLSHLGMPLAEQLTQEIAGIHVWVEVHNRGRLITPEKKGETIFSACRGRSSGYAEIYLSLDEEGTISNFVGQARTLPSKGLVNDTVVHMLADFQKRTTEKTAEARTRKSAEPYVSASQVEHRYVGLESCMKCHAGVYESWAETVHAQAYATIAETDQWNDPDCLLCHTTGYGQMSDRESGMIEPRFWNVQCEACHGRGTEHSRAAGAAAVPEHVCTECHNQSNSPEFDYETYLEHGVH